MKTVIDMILFATMAAVLGVGSLFFAGCKALPPENPVIKIEAPLQSGHAHVKAAINHLTEPTPNVRDAHGELKMADKDLTVAEKATVEVKEEVGGIITKLTDANDEIKKLKDSFFSYRQKKLFWWGVAISTVLGILAAVGNVRPGWWSLPALWAIKAVRFVLFAGIPHLVGAIRWLVQRLVTHPAVPAQSVPNIPDSPLPASEPVQPIPAKPLPASPPHQP